MVAELWLRHRTSQDSICCLVKRRAPSGKSVEQGAPRDAGVKPVKRESEAVGQWLHSELGSSVGNLCGYESWAWRVAPRANSETFLTVSTPDRPAVVRATSRDVGKESPSLEKWVCGVGWECHVDHHTRRTDETCGSVVQTEIISRNDLELTIRWHRDSTWRSARRCTTYSWWRRNCAGVTMQVRTRDSQEGGISSGNGSQGSLDSWGTCCLADAKTTCRHESHTRVNHQRLIDEIMIHVVNNCAHTLVVLVLCTFGTCRAFRLADVFSYGVLLSSFHVHPCLFASAYVCAVSFDVIHCTPCSETVLRPSSWPQSQTSHRQLVAELRFLQFAKSYDGVQWWKWPGEQCWGIFDW